MSAARRGRTIETGGCHPNSSEPDASWTCAGGFPNLRLCRSSGTIARDRRIAPTSIPERRFGMADRPARTARNHRPLARGDLPVDTETLARFLIGKLVVRELPEGIVSGRIVETEAYVVGDSAGHAFRGMTARNRVLFDEHGHAHIYLAYGVSYMLNVSSERAGIGAGVLLRAIEPLEGIAIMQHNRGVERLRDLARGPGRLTAALRVDLRCDGLDLCRKGPLWLGRDDQDAGEIGQSIRIGITKDADRLLRFYRRGSPFVSGPRSLNT
jgi:DNA-3-methyladenine glycosylase